MFLLCPVRRQAVAGSRGEVSVSERLWPRCGGALAPAPAPVAAAASALTAAGRPPRELAQSIIDRMPKSRQVERLEIAGPGFINFFIRAAAWHLDLEQKSSFLNWKRIP